MPLNWPPATAPPWPPPEISATWLSASDVRTLVAVLHEAGFTQVAPTSAERTAFFNAARCDHGHQVTGRMLVSPSNVRYPFAVCNNAAHRDLLVLWPPYYAGARSGEE
jgi:hypothetical protein